jgi:dihydroceramide fatty acyl 2-hydroxylase
MKQANTDAPRITIYRRPVLGAFLVSSSPLKSYVTAVLPISALLLAAIPGLGVLEFLAGFAFGVIQWTLLEYVIHRWIYHRLRRRILRNLVDSFHAHHHSHMDDPQVMNAGPLLVYPALGLAGLVDGLLFGMRPDVTAAILLGTTWAYAFYEWVHFRIHQKPERGGYLAWIQRYHLHHHYRSANSCYGNTSSLWDHVFGTYDARYRQLDASSAPSAHFHRGKPAHFWRLEPR